MVNRAKKPPIELRSLGDEEGVIDQERGNPGELGYATRGGGPEGGGGDDYPTEGRDWKGLLGSAIFAIFVAGLLLLFLTPSKASIKTLDENFLEIADRVEEVAVEVDALGSLSERVDAAVTEARSAKEALSGYAKKSEVSVPDLVGYAKSSDLTGLAKESDLSALQDAIADLEAQVSDLEDEVTSSSVYSTSDTTRWDMSVSVPSGLDVEYSFYPRPIEEDDFYELDLDVYSSSELTNARRDLVITLTLHDRGAQVFVDEANTYIEDWSSHASVSVYEDWYTTVDTQRRDDAVRRIKFESTYKLNFTQAMVDGVQPLRIELELSLAYK